MRTVPDGSSPAPNRAGKADLARPVPVLPPASGGRLLHRPARLFLRWRKAKLLADRQLEAGIGFPVRKRADAPQYAVPVKRRKIETPRRPTANGPFEPEPVLPDEQYEQALAVLRNARNSLERTPSMTATRDEERIRDLLLFFLNGQFEGAAAGEVFNAAGKTDILIRVGDRNVFIAECKIWKGRELQENPRHC